MMSILNARNQEERFEEYVKLFHVTFDTLKCVSETITQLMARVPKEKGSKSDFSILAFKLSDLFDVGSQVYIQAYRRIINGEHVKVEDKIVSIHERHTDIIVKKRRKTEFGHKICVTAGASSFVFDCQVLKGNPTDSSIATESVKRLQKKYEIIPDQVAMDSGFCIKIKCN